MEKYYTLIVVILIVLGWVWQYVKIKRLSERNIISDYSLKQPRIKLNLTNFVLPAIMLFAGLYEDINAFLVTCAALLIISAVVECVLSSKYGYDAFSIKDNNLSLNDFKIKNFNLEELVSVDHKPFSDSFQLKFKNGHSVSIYRRGFQNKTLNTFLKLAINKSKLQVSISEDAASKI